MTRALEEVAATADAVADEQRIVAAQAREMQDQRDQGWSWAKVLDHHDDAGVLGRLRHSAGRLAQAASHLGRTLATGLSDEGESHRSIGRRLGVTHQRVSAILGRDRHASDER